MDGKLDDGYEHVVGVVHQEDLSISEVYSGDKCLVQWFLLLGHQDCLYDLDLQFLGRLLDLVGLIELIDNLLVLVDDILEPDGVRYGSFNHEGVYPDSILVGNTKLPTTGDGVRVRTLHSYGHGVEKSSLSGTTIFGSVSQIELEISDLYIQIPKGYLCVIVLLENG